MYGWGAYRGGLGFTYYDLLDEAGREPCGARDSECIARNSERVTAVQDLWNSQYMADANTANLAAPPISIGLDTSASAYQHFMSNDPLTSETISVNGGPAVSDASLESGRVYIANSPLPAPTPASCSLPAPVAPSGSNPAAYIQYTQDLAKYLASCTGVKQSPDVFAPKPPPLSSYPVALTPKYPVVALPKLRVDPSGLPNAPTGEISADTGGPSLFSSIPWWGWLAGAGGLYYAFGGKR